MDTEKQKSSPGGTVPGEKVPPVLTAEDVAALEELCGDVSGYFYKMLDYLDQRVRDGVRQGGSRPGAIWILPCGTPMPATTSTTMTTIIKLPSGCPPRNQRRRRPGAGSGTIATPAP